MVKFSRNRRNGTKQEKHSGKGIAIAFATALFLNFSVKSLSRKVVQKFWGEVSVLSPISKNLMGRKCLNIENQSFQKRQFSCRSSSQGKVWGSHSYFPSVLYRDVIHIGKKQNECGIYKKKSSDILRLYW